MSQDTDFSNQILDEISIGDAHYTNDEEVVPKIINHEYAQHNQIKGISREFSLFDDIYLYCTLKSFNLKKLKVVELPQYRIDLTYMDPKPTRFVHIAWKLLLWGLIAIMASALVIYIGKYLDMPVTHQAILPPSILLGTLGFILLLLFYQKSYSNVIYRGYVGRAPLIMLSHKPRRKDYKEFVDILESNTHKAQRRNGITIKDRLVGEMKDMRRLRDAKVISEDKYKQAQARIFKHESNQS